VEPKDSKAKEGGGFFRGIRIESDGKVLGIGRGVARRSLAAGEKIFSRDVGI